MSEELRKIKLLSMMGGQPTLGMLGGCFNTPVQRFVIVCPHRYQRGLSPMWISAWDSVRAERRK